MSALVEAVKEQIRDAGGIRNLAHRTGLDPGYISRLSTGKKTNPSGETLRALGIVRAVTYQNALLGIDTQDEAA